MITYIPKGQRRLSFWVICEEKCPVLVLKNLNGEINHLCSIGSFENFRIIPENYLNMTLNEKRAVFITEKNGISFCVIRSGLEDSPYLYMKYNNGRYKECLASLKNFEAYGLNPNDFVNMKPEEVREVTLNIE